LVLLGLRNKHIRIGWYGSVLRMDESRRRAHFYHASLSLACNWLLQRVDGWPVLASRKLMRNTSPIHGMMMNRSIQKRKDKGIVHSRLYYH
jgi:hypothetical protein